MKCFKCYLLIAFLAFFLFSCVNDNYNLSELDTTLGVNIENLTIPLSIDSILLEEVIDLDENSLIKKTIINGEEIYAIVETGKFQSNKIDIPGFETSASNIAPIQDVLCKNVAQNSTVTRGYKTNNMKLIGFYPISHKQTSFSATGSVNSVIKNIQKLQVNAEYSMKIDVNDYKLMSKVNKIRFEGLKAKLPKGLEGKFELIDKSINDITRFYEKTTGIIDLSGQELTTDNGEMEFKITIDAIDLDNAGEEISFENGDFEFVGNIMVEEGDVAVYSDEMKDGITFDDLPNNIEYKCTSELNTILAQKLSGEIQYDIQGINIKPIYLNNIPELFSQKETNIQLKNPQMYIRIHNPLAEQNIWAEVGLGMNANRDGSIDKSVSLYEPLVIDDSENVFCLTSDRNMQQESMHEEYVNAEVIPFNGLDDILSGDGLPDEIEFYVNPQIPNQVISEFELNQDIEPVNGEWLFFAPVALKNQNSIISYVDTIKGWSDDTLMKLVIQKFKINADVKSNIPLTLELDFQPINVEGSCINVKTTDLIIDAGHTPQPVEVTIDGEIRELDGLVIQARIRGTNGEVIKPKQSIKLDNIKVQVSGYYIDEF